jgi:hypothetical protein
VILWARSADGRFRKGREVFVDAAGTKRYVHFFSVLTFQVGNVFRQSLECTTASCLQALITRA